MNTPSKFKKVGLSALAAIGLTAGAAGIAAAASSKNPPATDPPAAEQPADIQGSGQGRHDDGADYKSSITVPAEDASANEDDAAEQARLEKLAKISPEEATDAATKAVPGESAAPELDDEDGNLIYEVEVRKADGSIVEVIVDAGNAKVLAQEVDDEDGDDAADRARLEKLAKVSPDAAAKAATGAVHGTAGRPELDEENGSVVYEIDVIKDDGTEVEVTVDAVNRKVISQETDHEDGQEADEASGGSSDDGAEANSNTPAPKPGN